MNTSFNQSQNHQTKACSNCGDIYHDFNRCKLPIISLGIVMFNKDKDLLLIKRKNTMAFIDIIRGRLPTFKYMRIFDKFKILLEEITIEEKKMLETKTFEEMWYFLWGRGEHKRRREFSFAKKRFENNYDTILRAMKEVNIVWTQPEYSFPKGRKNSKENYLECAVRELEEETGYKKDEYEIIRGVSFTETYFGTNGIEYKHVYYLAKIKEPYSLPRVDIDSSEEVSNVGFFKREELKNLFRSYEKSKITVIKDIYNYLDNQTL